MRRGEPSDRCDPLLRLKSQVAGRVGRVARPSVRTSPSVTTETMSAKAELLKQGAGGSIKRVRATGR